MVYLYYVEIIDVLFMYRELKEQKGQKEKKTLQSLVNHYLFWHLMWAKTVGTSQALQR